MREHLVPVVWLACHLLVVNAGLTHTPRRARDLSFAESVYSKFSDACRAIMDLGTSPMSEQEDLVKTMKIVYLDGKTVKTFPISEALVELTKPLMFDITKETKVIIHGFKDSSQSAIPLDLARAYNEKRMFNVIQVDSEELVNKWYIVSVRNARLIGKRLAQLLANLEAFGANAADIHLLGISLGAHVAGWAGKYFKQFKSNSLGRITGLDPAGPCYTHAYSDQRLDKTDAFYVDVLHSNRLVQGVIEPLGHADFYINGGGPSQPGCIMPSCSHLRAAQLYTESVRIAKSFIGTRCKTWEKFLENTCEDETFGVMGYGSSFETRGHYFLRTASSSPFGLGFNGTKNIVAKSGSWLNMIETYT